MVRLEDMTVQDVHDWLANMIDTGKIGVFDDIQKQNTLTAVIRNQIDGEVLKVMSEHDLETILEVKVFGQRKKLHARIKEMVFRMTEMHKQIRMQTLATDQEQYKRTVTYAAALTSGTEVRHTKRRNKLLNTHIQKRTPKLNARARGRGLAHSSSSLPISHRLSALHGPILSLRMYMPAARAQPPSRLSPA